MDRDTIKGLIREVAKEKLLEGKSSYTITRDEWKKIHKDYKSTTGGKRSVMGGSLPDRLSPTVKKNGDWHALVPVNVVKQLSEADIVMGEWVTLLMAENMAESISEGVNKWMLEEAVDQHAVTELTLYIEKDGQIYRSRIQPIIKNLARKMAKDQYDEKKAIKAWMYAVEDGAKKYAKEFDSASNWSKLFDKKIREAVAEELRDRFFEEVEEMSYDFGTPK